MKKLTWCLLPAVWACAGCLDLSTGNSAANPWGGSRHGVQAEAHQEPVLPPKPVTPEQVSPGTARKAAEVLWQELDRADQMGP